MKDRDTVAIRALSGSGSMYTGHVILTNSKHANRAISTKKLYQEGSYIAEACEMIAFQSKGKGIDIVVGYNYDGARLALLTSIALAKIDKRPVQNMYAEINSEGTCKIDDYFKEEISGKNVLIIDDVLVNPDTEIVIIEKNRIPDGVAIKGLCSECANGKVIGVGVILNYGGFSAYSLGVPSLLSLTNLQQMEPFRVYHENDCPLCQRGIEVVKDHRSIT